MSATFHYEGFDFRSHAQDAQRICDDAGYKVSDVRESMYTEQWGFMTNAPTGTFKRCERCGTGFARYDADGNYTPVANNEAAVCNVCFTAHQWGFTTNDEAAGLLKRCERAEADA